MVVNTEWGDFFAASLPVCEEDDWVDAASVNPGRGRLEKVGDHRVGVMLGQTA